MITSVANSRVKEWAKLASSSVARRAAGLCILEGLSFVLEAAQWKLLHTILLKEGAPVPAGLPASIEVEILSEHCFKKISSLHTGQVMAVARIPHWEESWSSYTRLLICERIQNPDNLGALIRSAHAAEFDAVLITPGSADSTHPRTLRSSAGSALRFPTYTLSIEDIVTHTSAHDITLLALDAQGEYPLFEHKPTGKVALVVGNEGQGISKEMRANVAHTASLPINPQVESLNALVAASLAMYQVRWG